MQIIKKPFMCSRFVIWKNKIDGTNHHHKIQSNRTIQCKWKKKMHIFSSVHFNSMFEHADCKHTIYKSTKFTLEAYSTSILLINIFDIILFSQCPNTFAYTLRNMIPNKHNIRIPWEICLSSYENHVEL